MSPLARLTVRVRIAAALTVIAAVALSLCASASAATASAAIGQIAPLTPSVDCAGTDVDTLQPTVTSGPSYVVPPLPPAQKLMISSWSTNAATGAGQKLTMKAFREVANPATYKVVGHDGPRRLKPSSVNTFQSNVRVKPGDVLGSNSSRPAMTACAFFVAGESRLISISNLADGESGAFSTSTDYRTNISAVVEPSNLFKLGGVKRHEGNGTATLKVKVPNSGEMALTGKGVVKETKTVSPGAAKLKVSAKGQKLRQLNATGEVTVKAKVTYTPTGGDPNTQSRKLKLKQR